MTRLRRWLHARLDRAADVLESIGDCPEPNHPTLNPKGPSCQLEPEVHSKASALSSPLSWPSS